MTEALIAFSRRPKEFLYPIVAALLCGLLASVAPAIGGNGITIQTTLPRPDAIVIGNVPWLAEVSEQRAKTVDFYIDGELKWTELREPYQYHGDNTDGTLDTTKLSSGTHRLKVVANAANGSTATDEITITVANGVPPTVTTATPANGAKVSGVVSWEAVTSGVVTRVVFLVDGAEKWVENTTPYRYNSDGRFDTATLSDGRHELTVRAEGPGGSKTSSISVDVANKPVTGPGAPSITTAAPSDGAVLAGTVTWDASTTGQVTRVLFLVDGTQKWVENTTPYRYNSDGRFDTTTLSDGRHELTVKAEGPGGSSSSKIAVTVANVKAPTSAAPVSTAAPVVSGTPVSGETLSATTGTWTGTAPITLRRAWERCVNGTCTAVAGATSASFVVTSADVGASLRHAVTATNAVGSATARSAEIKIPAAAAPPPTAVKPTNTVAPVLAGTPIAGQSLSSTTGTWAGTAPIAYIRGWERCQDYACAPIAGATAGTYTLTASDIGTTVRHVVTASNSAGSTVARTSPSATVQPVTGPPVTVGTALPGRMPESTGASYYVNGASGSDSNPGTLAAPWRTINKALASVSPNGSIINVRAGTYVGMHQLINRYGSKSNPITLQPYAGERVILTAPANTDHHALLVYRAGGLRIRGLEITGATGNIGVKVENGDDIEIVDNEIHHTGRSGILVAGTGTSGPVNNHNIQVWNNRFHDNGGNPNVGSGSAGLGGHSIYWGGVGSNSDGIDHTTYGGVIANNLFYNQSYGFQLQIGSEASGLIVTNNTFYRATHPSPGGNTIVLYTESDSPQYVTRNVLIVNNLITWASNVGVYGSGGGGLMSTNLVRNNLAYANAKGDFLSYYGSTSNTLFQLGSNVTGQNPMFVNGGGLDFRLQAGSPAIGKADPAYAPPTDFEGHGRSGAPDLGALEH